MSWLLACATRSVRLLRAFAERRDGNVAIVTAFALVPMIGLLGLGIDYGVGLSNKAKLDNAADAAAVAAVASAKAYIAANQTDPQLAQNAITEGLRKASRSFSVNVGTLPFASALSVVTSSAVPPASNPCAANQACVYLSQSGQTLSSTVYYQASMQNHFGQMFGSPTLNVRNTSAATTQIPSYLDFYLLLDVSGSMGLPATTAGMSALSSTNRDMYSDYQQGCQFACHFPGNSGWSQAAGKIQLRSDAVNTAVCKLLARAASPLVANQYRVGLYPFINQMATLADLTADMSSLSTSMQCSATWPLALTNLLDTGATQLFTGNDPTTGTGSGGTHFEVVFPQVKSKVVNFGNGSSALQSKPFVFLVTDGMENAQHFFVMNKGNYAYPGSPSQFRGFATADWDGSQPSQIDPTVCQALKTAGVTISILYIPYNIINFVNNSGGIAWENNRVNGFSPTLTTPLRQCASSGYFYTANTPADITAALDSMFTQAVQVTHLTQ